MRAYTISEESQFRSPPTGASKSIKGKLKNHRALTIKMQDWQKGSMVSHA